MTDFKEVKHSGTSCLGFKSVKDFSNFKTKLKGLCDSGGGGGDGGVPDLLVWLVPGVIAGLMDSN